MATISVAALIYKLDLVGWGYSPKVTLRLHHARHALHQLNAVAEIPLVVFLDDDDVFVVVKRVV